MDLRPCTNEKTHQNNNKSFNQIDQTSISCIIRVIMDGTHILFLFLDCNNGYINWRFITQLHEGPCTHSLRVLYDRLSTYLAHLCNVADDLLLTKRTYQEHLSHLIYILAYHPYLTISALCTSTILGTLNMI